MTAPLPALAWRALQVPRRGHTAAECEDAFAGDPQGGRFAVADGATESAFAGPWAALLAEGYVRSPGPWHHWLPEARACWQEQLRGRDLPWYAEAKADEGAFATLLGVAFADDRGHWRAEAVGDSCLFQVRGGRLRCAFPVRHAADFGNQPDLLCSRPRTQEAPKVKKARRVEDWRVGDALLLMTDALSYWFLRETEEGRRPWETLAALTDGDFAPWLDELRQTRQVRNDDVTLVFIRSGMEASGQGLTS
jgi:hypothetical protein